MTFDEIFMARCIEIAHGGSGETSPNPMVGAVIVHNGAIIGEGFHRRIGEPHAEVNAIASVRDEGLLSFSTLYVSLEPCSHYGKTPPCSELIIRKNIPRVVVGCLDPYPEVSGRGVRMLREAGIEVVTGVLEQEARALNKAFITLQEKGRPYIILKWAQSADGFMDRLRTDSSIPPVQFSTPQTRRLMHKLRAETAAIMVGTHTALLDNPSLSVRHWAGRSPVRVVLDRYLQLPSSAHLLDGSISTIIFSESLPFNHPPADYCLLNFSQPILPQILKELAARQLDSLLVEGGANLLNQFLEQGLWDEIQVETAPFRLEEGVKAPTLPSGTAYRPFIQPSSNRTIVYKQTI